MKPILTAVFLSFIFSCFGQQVVKRMVFIGDAGEINLQQETLVPEAAKMILPHQSVAFFLGDNIYPEGMGLSGADSIHGAKILQSQYLPFREKDVPVYFLSGNHDWDHSGIEGLQKIKAQETYLQQRNDPGLHFIPPAGSYLPQAIDLTPDLVAITYDSEYWLFPHHEVGVNNKIKAQFSEFLTAFDELLTKNAGKTILVLSHHPMKSFGPHSLTFGWKDHLFPLTAKWPNAYLPLPVIGSLYPLFRAKVFSTPEDQKHPAYQMLIEGVVSITKKRPNVIFISGHDHGLQFISKDSFTQIVSGSGAKTSSIVSNKNLLYKHGQQGFVIVDFLSNRNLDIRYYIYSHKSAEIAFQTQLEFQTK